MAASSSDPRVSPTSFAGSGAFPTVTDMDPQSPKTPPPTPAVAQSPKQSPGRPASALHPQSSPGGSVWKSPPRRGTALEEQSDDQRITLKLPGLTRSTNSESVRPGVGTKRVPLTAVVDAFRRSDLLRPDAGRPMSPDTMAPTPPPMLLALPQPTAVGSRTKRPRHRPAPLTPVPLEDGGVKGVVMGADHTLPRPGSVASASPFGRLRAQSTVSTGSEKDGRSSSTAGERRCASGASGQVVMEAEVATKRIDLDRLAAMDKEEQRDPRAQVAKEIRALRALQLPKAAQAVHPLWNIAQIRSISAQVSIKGEYSWSNNEALILEWLAGSDPDVTVHIVDIEMDRAAGVSLKQRVETTRLTESECQHVVRELLKVLRHMHDHGYVHNDVKPDNIIAALAGNPGVADARSAGGDAGSPVQQGNNGQVTLVDLGEVLCARGPELTLPLRDAGGTAGFRAPECTYSGSTGLHLERAAVKRAHAPEGSRPDMSPTPSTYSGVLSDLFSVGATACTLLTGAVLPAYQGMSDSEQEWTERVHTIIEGLRGSDGVPVSEDCKDFLRRTLILQPRERMIATHTLKEHPWVVTPNPDAMATA